MRGITRRGGAAVAVSGAVAGMTAAAAMAVTPPPSGIFDGHTSQTQIGDNAVRVKTDANSHVSKFKIRWEAKCKVKGKYWTSRSTISGGANGLPMKGDVFKKNKTYTADAGNGITGRITYAMKGHFTDNDHAVGTWNASVVVKRNGTKIDSCKTPNITWSVTRTA